MLSLLLAATLSSVAMAHATLLSSTPAVGSTITTLPSTIRLTFDDVLTSESSFVVLGSGGLTVATGALDPTDSKSLIAPMPALTDGTYDVRWTAISADDGFLERDSFQFKVVLATAAPSGDGSPSAAPTTAATPTPSAAPGSDGGGSGDVLVPIVVVAILVGGGLAWFLRRRTSR
jgi:methionine-rich copper-binding protein CopC